MRQPLLLTTLTILATTLLFAMPASAEPRIKTNGCKVYATNRVDPIASMRHLHHHFGNTQTSNRSTGERLKNRGRSSCAQEASWFTSGRSEEHTSELQSRQYLVCRLLLDKKK